MNDPGKSELSTVGWLARLGLFSALLGVADLLMLNPYFGLLLPILPKSLWDAATHHAMIALACLMVLAILLGAIALLGRGGRKEVTAPAVVGIALGVMVGVPLSAGFVLSQRIAQAMAAEQANAVPPASPVPSASARPTPVASVLATPVTAAAAKAVGFYIPALDRVDMVHDARSNILYISAGDSVLRYKVDSKDFLPPLVLGGDLRGIDLSPDQTLLAVADGVGDNGRVCVHLVNLETGKDAPASFTAEMMESGTFSVAFGADSQLWISSSCKGSGWVPLRKYNPATHAVLMLSTICQDTMLTASADRQSIGFAESNMSPGAYGRILYRATQLPKAMSTDGFLFEIGISRDGKQLAVPAYRSLVLTGSAVRALDEKQIIGVTYHPQKDYLFLAQAGTSLLGVYDSSTMTRVKDLDFGDPFGWVGNHAFQSGRLRVSQDGKYLFCTVSGGVRGAETGL